MFSRFRDSLVYPKLIIEYRKDHILFVLFYIVFFAVLLSTSAFINVYTFDGIGETGRALISDNLTDKAIDCSIDDKVLTCDEAAIHKIYEQTLMTFYLDSSETVNFDNYQANGYNIIFNGDDVLVYVFGFDMAMPLDTLPSEFHNLDFRLIETDREAFITSVTVAIDAYAIDQKGYWGTMVVGMDFLMNMIFFMFIILFSSWILKSRFKPIPFKHIFRIATYTSTAMFLLMIFNSLINLSIFFFVIFIFVAFRQTNAVSMEIMKRIQMSAPINIKAKETPSESKVEDEAVNESSNESDREDSREDSVDDSVDDNKE